MVKSPVKRPANRTLEKKETEMFTKLERISTVYKKQDFEAGLAETESLAKEIEAAKKEGMDVKEIKRENTR